jgi:NAD(P)-dependent dehydrogenase (short-subunit alcohol dehydrogenase family)
MRWAGRADAAPSILGRVQRAPGPRIALVTGASAGIGRAVAEALLTDGWRVALVGRRAELLAEVAAARADGTLVLSLDVRDTTRLRAAFAEVAERWGRLDLLFNNAGANAPPVPLEELTLEQWQAVVDVNLTAMFVCTQEAVRLMKRQDPRGGRILNNGSISAHVPRPNSAPYTATKHAVTGLTRSTALDGRAFDIACGQIDIGNAATAMTEVAERGMPQPDGRIAAEPRFDVAHVARAVVEIANLPLDVNVPFMTLMATGMPYLGRG